jgi:hypothetical protein
MDGSIFAIAQWSDAGRNANSARGGIEGAIRRICVISALLRELPAGIKCQFGGHSRASRLSFQRIKCKICKKIAVSAYCAVLGIVFCRGKALRLISHLIKTVFTVPSLDQPHHAGHHNKEETQHNDDNHNAGPDDEMCTHRQELARLRQHVTP